MDFWLHKEKLSFVSGSQLTLSLLRQLPCQNTTFSTSPNINTYFSKHNHTFLHTHENISIPKKLFFIYTQSVYFIMIYYSVI